MKWPRWNPEGFWRQRRIRHTLACGGRNETNDCDRPSHDKPPAILVGRRRAKAMRRAAAGRRGQ